MSPALPRTAHLSLACSALLALAPCGGGSGGAPAAAPALVTYTVSVSVSIGSAVASGARFTFGLGAQQVTVAAV